MLALSAEGVVMDEPKKERKINRAWNAYIEPRRHIADVLRCRRQAEIRDYYAKRVYNK